jgi:rhodanese-related sulfurtransferase
VNFLAFIAQEWLLVSLLAAFIAVYFFTERIKSGLPISTHELTSLVNSENAVIVDIRPITEFKLGHLVDAINIPYEKMNSDITSLEKYKTKTIILIDKMGQHAGSIGNKLKKQGFDIRRLSGGISEWQAQNLPLIKAK